MKMLWWIIGITGLYGTYKVLSTWQRVVEVSTQQIAAKITFHRERARRGVRESVLYLKSLDSALQRIEREGSNAGVQIITSLQLQGLYPPSAI
jgi:hypothetical protein